MVRAARSLMCLFGLKCRRGLGCHCGDTDVEKKLFADRKALRVKERMAPCGFCAVGRCRYGAECQRSIRSRMSNEAYQKQSAPAAESESDYASAESGSDSGSESADEAGMTGPAGCGAEGMVPDSALVPFLSKDFTKVTKGWRPNVSSKVVKGEYRGFGEASVYWMLNVMEKPVPPGSDDQCEVNACGVDAVGFTFKQSEGAVMSQKAQRRMVRQKKVEEGWAGPAVVREQRTERRVPVGHRGSGMQKVLFADSGEDSSDGGGNGSGSEVEGGCSRARAKNRARQRSITIRQDTAERKKRAATKAVRRSLPEDPDVAVALVVETELEREEAMRRRCEVEQAELAAGKMAAAKAQSVRNALVEDSNESHSAEQLPVVDGSVSQQHRLQSLRKIQLWAWRRRVQDNMDQIKLCFQKWVAGGLAGCFIRKYTRRLGKDECHAVQVAAARHCAATVLRTVLLYRAVKVAQCSISDLTYLKDSFGGWLWCAKRDIRNMMRDIRWLCDIVMRRVYNMEVGMAWRQWKFWSGVHKAEKVLRDFGVESLRGATRQWVFNLWCTVCSATIAAIAEVEAAKKITGAETLERVVVRLMIRTGQKEAVVCATGSSGEDTMWSNVEIPVIYVLCFVWCRGFLEFRM